MKILLGVSSSIALYKSLDLLSELRKKGHETQVILTKNALKMVSTIPFFSLSGRPVCYDEFKEKDYIPHISLSDWADIFVIAPATANIIGKIANGIADDLLSTTFLAFRKPILIAPAMNTKMYEHPVVQKNIATLKAMGIHFVEPAEGVLACGAMGKGKLAPVSEILSQIEKIFHNTSSSNNILKNKKIVITAGGTIEDIDPVRFITNRSSGKMGIAFAQKAIEMGAEVTLIYANIKEPLPSKCRLIGVRSALEMLTELKKTVIEEKADILVMAAAVADFRPEKTMEHKIKKTEEKEWTLKLVKNPDLLKELSLLKQSNQIFIGFALETQDLIPNAQKKLKDKNLDILIANGPDNFEKDTASVKILSKDGRIEDISELSKENIAELVLKRLS